jgi:hypothetical protein
MSKLNNTTDQELFDYAEILNVNINQIATKDNFKGSIKDGFYIANLDRKTGTGTHWTVFYCVNDIFLIYFDSFGFAPPTALYKFFGKKTIVYSTDQIQAIDSNACGYYCLAFINYFSKLDKTKLRTIKQIRFHGNVFTKPFDVQYPKKNDDILLKQLRQLFWGKK